MRAAAEAVMAGLAAAGAITFRSAAARLLCAA